MKTSKSVSLVLLTLALLLGLTTFTHASLKPLPDSQLTSITGDCWYCCDERGGGLCDPPELGTIECEASSSGCTGSTAYASCKWDPPVKHNHDDQCDPVGDVGDACGLNETYCLAKWEWICIPSGSWNCVCSQMAPLGLGVSYYCLPESDWCD